MKKIGIVIFTCLLLLTGCISNRDYFQNQVNANLINECWVGQINTNPCYWLVNADSWFLNGEPNRLENYALTAPNNAAITSMNIRARGFTNINAAGSYQLQIIGHQDHDSVSVIGPNLAARQVGVDIQKQTLSIRECQQCPTSMSNVIVRIGVKNLRHLAVYGNVNVYGRDIWSDQLEIKANTWGNIFLAGNMNLTHLTQLGRGAVTILDAITPMLDIDDYGCGNVNVAGRVGIRSIHHCGLGCISIIGADSDMVNIDATNKAIVKVSGYVNLKNVMASKCAQVYLYCVNSCGTHVVGRDKSRISLGGNTENLNVELTQSSLFQGTFLHGGNVYVRTLNYSHANVTADKKVFACAGDGSSIYFFGSPCIVSRFVAQHGIVIPVWNEMSASPCCPKPCSTPCLPQIKTCGIPRPCVFTPAPPCRTPRYK